MITSPKNWKKVLILSFILLLPFNSLLAAQDQDTDPCVNLCPPEVPLCFPNPLKVCTLQDALGKIVSLMFYFGFMGGFVIVLWGILLFTLKGSEKGSLNRAITFIKYGLIGMVGLLIARPLVLGIARIFGLK